MAQTATNSGTAREAALARRRAMSTSGKKALKTGDRVRGAKPARHQGLNASAPPKGEQNAEADKRTRDKTGCGCGCKGKQTSIAEKPNGEWKLDKPATKPRLQSTPAIAKSPGRAASMARRQATSAKGKSGINKQGMTTAQAARITNPQLSGRELAQTIRAKRSQTGNAGQKKSEPCGRIRPGKFNPNKPETGAAQDAPWKVGASETQHGQTLTGTMVGRSNRVTGDEPSTCRGVTGTEYLGADIFRAFCQNEPSKSPRKVGVSATFSGNRVTGNEVGRGRQVTGNEPGTCKRVTGNEYVGAEQEEGFCQRTAQAGPHKITSSDTRKGKTVTGNNVGRSGKVTGDETGSNRTLTGSQYMQQGNGKAPSKVGHSATLRGGSVTGTMVGRSQRMTGDEAGSCRNVSGDDYIGQEQYQGFCPKTPTPQDQKVGLTTTLKGKSVTGTMTGRDSKVTGSEPGTCKSVTGTPYAGADQYVNYCDKEETNLSLARTASHRAAPGAPMTGLQPGLGGKLTGADKGACEPLTGTPYVGADQFANVCPATPAEPGSPDFPQPLGNTPWGQFSVNAPNHATRHPQHPESVTGTRYEQGQITGPFGMATGKVTGTEEARFHNINVTSSTQQQPLTAWSPAAEEAPSQEVKSRITGEGMDAGPKITGDDWDRGDSITGTEGTSAVRRNPTRRSAMNSAMPAVQTPKRNENVSVPESRVTGGSGNTEKGAVVTYSGGARG